MSNQQHMTPDAAGSDTGNGSQVLREAMRRLDAISGMVRVAHALALERRPLDLTGLDCAIGMLCASALDLPPAEGRALRARLIGLLHAIESLAEALPNSALQS